MFGLNWRYLASSGDHVAPTSPGNIKNVAWRLKILAWRPHAEH
ncbi:hypothetical protein A2U01_0112333, partial [Trifolium medium]|nr:hypothetical protein [Trifolium medium]